MDLKETRGMTITGGKSPQVEGTECKGLKAGAGLVCLRLFHGWSVRIKAGSSRTWTSP